MALKTAVLLLLGVATATHQATLPVAVTRMRVDLKSAPSMGLVSAHPRFSWTLPSGLTQETYQVHVCSDRGMATTVWDSGVQASNESLSVSYQGSPLAPGGLYFWEVAVTALNASAGRGANQLAVKARSSGPAMFHMYRPFNPACRSIWAPSGNYVFLRKKITPRSTLASAVLSVTALQDGSKEKLLGAYRLYLNGQPLITGPGRGMVSTDAGNHTLVDVIDATDLLLDQPSFIVGLQGYHDSAKTGAIVLQLDLRYTDGNSEAVVTDSSWSAFDANPIFNPTGHTTGGAYKQPTEYINGDNLQPGWPTLGFTESSAWTSAVAKPLLAGLAPKLTLPVQFVRARDPKVAVLGSGQYFVDFETEIMATLQLSLRPETLDPRAQRVNFDMTLGEELSANHTIRSPMRTGNNYATKWTTASSSAAPLSGHEYMLFRYASINVTAASASTATCGVVAEGDTAQLSCPSGQLISLVSFASYGTPSGACSGDGSNDFKADPKCNSGNSTQAVHAACVGKPSCTVPASNTFFGGDPCHETVKHLSVAVACKPGAAAAAKGLAVGLNVSAWRVGYPWAEGDASFQSSSPLLDQVWALCENTLRVTSLDTATDSNTRERLPYEADLFIAASSRFALQDEYLWPRHSLLHSLANPTWPTEWRQCTPLAAYQDYMKTGDPAVARLNWDLLLNGTQVNCLNKELGLVDFRHCARVGERDLIDWPQGSRDGYVLSDVSTVINAYAYGSLVAMHELGTALGRPAAELEAIQNNLTTIKAGMTQHLLNKSTGLFTDGLNISHSAWHATVFPMWFGLTPDTSKAAVLGFLRGGMDQGFVGSVYAAYAALHGLYTLDADKGQLALDLMTSCSDNSWCHMLQVGATATMEAWSTTEKPNLSFSHPWASSATGAIVEGLMGLTMGKAGFAEFTVAPQPGNLTAANLTIPSLSGPITTSFRQTSRSLEVWVAPPGNTRYTVCLAAAFNARAPVAAVTGQGRATEVPLARDAKGRLCAPQQAAAMHIAFDLLL